MPLKVVATSQPDTRYQDALAGRPRPQGSAGSTLKVIASQAGDIVSGAASGAAEAAKDFVDQDWGFSEAEFFLTFLRGREGAVIDETYYKESDREFIKSRVLDIYRETGQTSGSFGDYEKAWGVPEKGINSRSVTEGLTDRGVRVSRTLGSANWEIVDGEVIITDTYNFNSGELKQAREGMYQYLKTGRWPEDIEPPSQEQLTQGMFWLNALAYKVQEDRREQGKDPDIPVRLNLGKVDE